MPGQQWQMEIPKAVHDADIVLICLSRQSVAKSGYVQKEIKFALDAADEKPEGTIFLIPAKLSECDIPQRLSAWQWVNLSEQSGYDKLLNALRVAAGSSIGQLRGTEVMARLSTVYPSRSAVSGLAAISQSGDSQTKQAVDDALRLIFAARRSAVVQLDWKVAQGSQVEICTFGGFLVTEDGYFIVCEWIFNHPEMGYSAVEDDTGTHVTLADGRRYPARLISGPRSDPRSRGLALFKIDARDLPSLTLAAQAPVVDEPVLLLKSFLRQPYPDDPRQMALTAPAIGQVQGLVDDLLVANFTETFKAQFRLSGCPLLNTTGEVVGMDYATDGLRCDHFIQSSTLRAYLNENGVQV